MQPASWGLSGRRGARGTASSRGTPLCSPPLALSAPAASAPTRHSGVRLPCRPQPHAPAAPTMQGTAQHRPRPGAPWALTRPRALGTIPAKGPAVWARHAPDLFSLQWTSLCPLSVPSRMLPTG